MARHRQHQHRGAARSRHQAVPTIVRYPSAADRTTSRRTGLEGQQKYMFTGSKAAGLGFYIDQQTRMTSSEATKMETGRGFLSLFANFQLVLINVQSSAIEAHENVAVATVRAASRAEDKNPWNALSADQKIQVLQELMKREIERVVPTFLGSPKS